MKLKAEAYAAYATENFPLPDIKLCIDALHARAEARARARILVICDELNQMFGCVKIDCKIRGLDRDKCLVSLHTTKTCVHVDFCHRRATKFKFDILGRLSSGCSFEEVQNGIAWLEEWTDLAKRIAEFLPIVENAAREFIDLNKIIYWRK
jgi:hypothetical protein